VEATIINHETHKTHETQYVWGLDLNGEYHGLGGVGGLLAVIDKSTGAVSIPLMDAKGTIYALLDTSNGSLIDKRSYDPYGRPMGAVASTICPFGFQTKYYDPETGTYYYGLRHYDPVTCRWQNRDPIEEQGGVNLYAFVNNNPVNKWDYLGLEYMPIPGNIEFEYMSLAPSVARHKSLYHLCCEAEFFLLDEE
jgi:RHS repeat-associated protein